LQSSCPKRASVQSALHAAPGAPVAGQPATAMRSPCFSDAPRAQHAMESTCRFHVVRRLATLAPRRSCAFATQLANVAALHPPIEGKIKGHGTTWSKSIETSTRHHGAQISSRAVFVRNARNLKEHSGTALFISSAGSVFARRGARLGHSVGGCVVHDPEHVISRNGHRWL
jgi:hypothetical protein